MARKMLIDATHPEETRVVVADGKSVEEFDFETESRLRLAGNIYLAKVTRVEPSLQAAFVDYGGNRHGFLAFSEVHPDYYQIPIADRQAILAEEEAFDRMQNAESEVETSSPKRSRRRRSRSRSEAVRSKDSAEITALPDDIPGMGVVELDATSDLIEANEPESPSNGQDAASSEPDLAVPPEIEEVLPDGSEGTTEEAAAVEDIDGVEDRKEGDGRIESITGDEAEEIRQPRKPRPRPYNIQEVIKVRQILLVQVIKEERGNKGAALTTYISLAGRYCVLMPNTARGGGISRKITNVPDRNKLKEIASKLDVPKGAGLIIRTAGATRTKSEIKRDYEFLQRLWEQIRELTLSSIAPVQIYEEGNLIKRSIRDLYNREIDEVLVEGEVGYRTAKDFMKMIMPSHAKRVKSYQDSLPLFARHQIETHLSSMYSPTVQLKSGGYIVIGETEALVAIDVNSGRATREGSVEETALKTNLEAAEEIARQLRLRDLAGLIVIDFIDMYERRNNAAVEKRFKDRLRTDRARIQVGHISGFGLLEMSRQRQRLGMIEATTQICAACHGTGRVRSDENHALSVLRELEEEVARRRHRELLLKAPVGVVNFLFNQKREHVTQIETCYGISVRIEADAAMVTPDYQIEKLKSAARTLRPIGTVVSVDALMMPDPDEENEEVVDAEDAAQSKEKSSRTRRRGRKGRRGGGSDAAATEELSVAGNARQEVSTDSTEVSGETVSVESSPEGTNAGKRTGGSRRSRSRKARAVEHRSSSAVPVSEDAKDVVDALEPAPEKKSRKLRRKRSGRAGKRTVGETQEMEADSDKGTPTELPQESISEPGTYIDSAGSSERSGSETAMSEQGIGADPETPSSLDKPISVAGSETADLPEEEDSRSERVAGELHDSSPNPKRSGWWKVRA